MMKKRTIVEQSIYRGFEITIEESEGTFTASVGSGSIESLDTLEKAIEAAKGYIKRVRTPWVTSIKRRTIVEQFDFKGFEVVIEESGGPFEARIERDDCAIVGPFNSLEKARKEAKDHITRYPDGILIIINQGEPPMSAFVESVSFTVGDAASCIELEDQKIVAALVEFEGSVAEGECPVCMLCEKVEWKSFNDDPPGFFAMMIPNMTEEPLSEEGEFRGFVWGICDGCGHGHADLVSLKNAVMMKINEKYPGHADLYDTVQ